MSFWYSHLQVLVECVDSVKDSSLVGAEGAKVGYAAGVVLIPRILATTLLEVLAKLEQFAPESKAPQTSVGFLQVWKVVAVSEAKGPQKNLCSFLYHQDK